MRKESEDTPPLDAWANEDSEHPADGPDESDEAPPGPYDELSSKLYDKLPSRAPMRKPGFVGARRDITRTRIPYRRLLPRLRGRGR